MVFPCEETASGGELCFICSTHNDLRIQANVFGHVRTSKNWKGWEVWRLVSSNRGDQTFFISPWTHSQFYLSSSPKGRVTTTRNQYRWELWKLEKETNGTEHTIRIRSLEHDRFLQLEHGRLSTVVPSRVSNNCWWNLEHAHLDKYYLHCMGRNRQLGCRENIEEAPFSTKSFDPTDDTLWVIQKAAADQGNNNDLFFFTIRSNAHGWYLRSTPNASQVTFSAEPGAEGWELTHHPTNGSVVITASADVGGTQARTLACSQNDHILLVHNDDHAAALVSSTSWQLVPHMPKTRTRKELFIVAGAGLASIAFGLATPSLGMGLFHTLGFTAKGIAPGSFAAQQMSRISKAH